MVLACLGGCKSPDLTPIEEVVGQPYDLAIIKLVEDITIVTQDASPRVNEMPAFDGSQLGSPDWIVVAVCSDVSFLEEARSIQFAVVPSRSYTREVQVAVERGDFEDSVICN